MALKINLPESRVQVTTLKCISVGIKNKHMRNNNWRVEVEQISDQSAVSVFRS